MPEFATFDQRRYPTVSAREGYAAWHPTYEDSVQDIMDLGILERISSVPWRTSMQVADLGCGSGRTAAWLAERGVVTIDGVDLTPEMLRSLVGSEMCIRDRPSSVRAIAQPKESERTPFGARAFAAPEGERPTLQLSLIHI